MIAKREESGRADRARPGPGALPVLALLTALALVALTRTRPRGTADRVRAPFPTTEHEPSPLPLVAPRPPAARAPAPASALDARGSVVTTVDDGRASTQARPASAPRDPALARLHLRVSADGRPAPLSWVELLGSGDGWSDEPRLERSDGTGLLELELPPGALRVVAWNERATALPRGAELAAGAETRLELELEPALPVAGRVVAAGSGLPLADAEVSFWTCAERDVVRTREDGTFEHPRFPAGAPAQQVQVRAAGHARAVRYLRIAADGSWKLPGALAGEAGLRGAGTPWIEFALQPELRVRGRAVDDSGRPLGRARVQAEGFFHVLPSVASRDQAATTTDEQGSFELAGLRPDVGHELSIEAPGCARLTLELALDPGGESLPGTALELGDLCLQRECVLAGVVIDGDGVPLADVEVLLTPLERAPVSARGVLDVPARIDGVERRVRTCENGTFLFEGLRASTMIVSARTEQGDLVEQELVPRADGSFAEPVLVLAPAWARGPSTASAR